MSATLRACLSYEVSMSSPMMSVVAVIGYRLYNPAQIRHCRIQDMPLNNLDPS